MNERKPQSDTWNNGDPLRKIWMYTRHMARGPSWIETLDMLQRNSSGALNERNRV